MNIILRRINAIIIFALVITVSGNDNNETVTNERRQSRVTGRIVKLYTGTRPPPVLCRGEGFQEDPNDCAVFYRCTKSGSGKFTVFRFQCGPGTIYDPEKEVCNHPQSTKRTKCGGLEQHSLSHVHTNEIEGSKNEIPSPITTSTSPPNFVTQNLISFKPQEQQTQQSILQNTIILPPRTTTVQQQALDSVTPVTFPPAHQNLQTNDGDNSCTTDGFMGDNQNCRKFYRCVGNQRGGFTKYEFSCSEPTVWDDDSQSCNHAWAVKRGRCGRTNLKQGNNKSDLETSTNKEPYHATDFTEANDVSDKTIQEQLQISYGSKVTQSQTQISNGSVVQNQTQINYGNRVKPSKDLKATQNQSQLSNNSATSQTQTQISYGDKGVQTQLQIDHSKQSSQTQIQEYETTSDKTTTTTRSTTSNTNKLPNNQCTQSGFIGDSNDCKKFYRCVENGKGSYTKYEFSCGEGTVWDQNIQACNHAWAVKECGGTTSTGTTQLDTTTSKTTENYVTSTSSTSISTESHNTSPGIIATDDDQDDGYGNQIQEQSTTSKTTTVKTTNKPVSNGCQNDGFIGDENDCRIFYRCVDNGQGGFTKYEFKCGEGTVWDPEISACNHAWAVKKCGGQSSDGNNNIETSTNKQSTTPLATTSLIVTEVAPTQNDDYDTGYGSQTDGSTTTTTQKPTTSNNGIGSTCKNSGFMGDENDCKKFYRCVDNGNGGFTKYEFACGEGTVWDPKIEACNHAWAVEHCGGSTAEPQNVSTSSAPTSNYPTTTSTLPDSDVTTTEASNLPSSTSESQPSQDTNECKSSGFIGSKNDCKKFYRCVDNGDGSFKKYEFACGEGTVWDQEIEACNHAWAVKSCGYVESSTSATLESTSQITTVNSDADSSDQGFSQQTESTSTTETSINQGVSNNEQDCNEEGFMGDKIDCKKFYRCVENGKGGYTKYEFSCGEGTYWNQEILSCDHASSTNTCKQTTNQTTTTGPPQENDEIIEEAPATSGTSTTEGVDGHTTQKIETAQGTECTSEGFYGDKNDCKKFYRCVDDGKGSFIKYEFTCAEGTVWDSELQTCNHESTNSNCTVNTKPSSSTTATSTSQAGEISTSMSTENYYPTETNNNVDGANQCMSEGYFEDPNDCRKFIRCVSNGKGGYTKYEFTCGEGTIWVQDLLACDHDTGDETCSIKSTNKPDTTVTTTSTTTSRTTTTATITTANNQQTTESPEVENTTTPLPQSTTEKQQDELSDESSDEGTKCTQEGYFGNKQDCKKFYRCVDNGKGGYTKYDFDCGEGTIWDQDLTVCNHPQDVANPSCNQSQGGGTTSTTDSTSSSSTMSSSSTSGSSSSSSSPGGSTTSSSAESTTQSSSNNCSQEQTKKPDDNNVNCTKEGYYPNPNDCKKFYRCVDWDGDGTKFSVFHFECGEGTIWDPAVETCNHEDSVYPPRDCSGSQSQSESTTESSSSTEETTTQQQTTSEQTTTQSTTTDSTTTQKSTTQQSTSTEQSTTQESTTSQQTTTQQSSTSEQTTQQSTTSEQTTQHSNTSEQTTQQSTTSEQTTQQSTTSEQTTQQSTTSEQTTQQSTTSEQTTQQSTTSEQTTQQSTTSEQTTQQSTTSEQTTQQSTASEQTTQQPTTSEMTTSESSTTTEQTTELTTTEQHTTQQTTTEQNDQSTTENTNGGTSTTEQSNDSSTTEQSDQNTGGKDCPETEDDQHLFVCSTSSFKRHPKYCNLFYQCDDNEETHEINISVFSCPNNTIYDESQTKCVAEDKAAKKCDGEIAQRRKFKSLKQNHKEPIFASRGSYACPSAGYFPFEKENECSPGFLKCEKSKSNKLRGLVYQCPPGYLYWTISKRCEPIPKLKGCKQPSRNNWSDRWQIPVERKNVAYV